MSIGLGRATVLVEEVVQAELVWIFLPVDNILVRFFLSIMLVLALLMAFLAHARTAEKLLSALHLLILLAMLQRFIDHLVVFILKYFT